MAPEPATDETWSAAIAGAVLRRGAMVHAASLVLTMAALLASVAVAFVTAKPGAVWLSVGVAVVLLGAVEFWLAARVALDAELFDTIAGKGADLAGFDRAMLALGLMPVNKANRALALRIRGALRLLRLQALALAAQVVVLIAGAWWA
jgi:hypothetical protein